MEFLVITLVVVNVIATLATTSWLWQRLEGELHRRTLFLNHRMTDLISGKLDE